MKKAKLLWFVLILVLFVTALTFLVSATDKSIEPTLKIEGGNLSFDDSVYILYAVSHEGIDAKDVRLYFWNEPQSGQNAYAVETADYSFAPYDDGVVVNGKPCVTFKNNTLRAKNMTDYVYARAYAKVDGVSYYSEVSKYSILQYAYNTLGKTAAGTDKQSLKDMLTAMLEYGAMAQIHFDNYHTDRLANADYYQLKTVGGLLPDGFSKGLYLADEKVVLTAPETEGGLSFVEWRNSAGESVSTNATVEITVGTANETYTAIYCAQHCDVNDDSICDICGAWTYTAVATYAELQAALNAGEKYIVLTADITTTEYVDITKDVVLDGNGKTLTNNGTGSNARGIRIITNGIDVTIQNLTVKATKASSRGVQVNVDVKDVKLHLEKCNITATAYGINICDGAGADLIMTDCNVTAWGALNLWSADYKVKVVGGSLNGVAPANTNESYGTIVLEGNVAENSALISVDLIDVKITADASTKGEQYFVVFNPGATGNNVTCTNCEFVAASGDALAGGYYDGGTCNTLIINGVKVPITDLGADIATAQKLNTAAIAADADTFDDAIHAVQEAGYYVANLNAKTSDCYFVWEDDSNQFILYDLKNEKILYSNSDIENDPDADWCFAASNPTVANAIKAVLPNITIKITAATMSDLKATIAAGGEATIYVDQSVVVDSKNAVVINDAKSKITLELGSSTISGNNNDGFSIENVPFQVTAGEITLKGGVVAATGTMLDADNKPMQNVVNVQNATVKLEDTKIDAPNATIPVALTGATATIKDTTIVAHDNVIQPSNGSIVTIENTNIECQYLAVYSTSSGGTASEVTIKSGNYHSVVSNLLGVHGGVIVVEGGTFNCDNAAKTLKFYNVTGGKIVIKGGTFNGIAFADLTEDIIRGMCNLSDCAKGVDVTKDADGAWTIVVK